MNYKKSAMFGLDARIALTIFGSLSLISGAALYSVIQKSKATSMLVDLREIGKAWEQFYLNTGKNLSISKPLCDGKNCALSTKDLVVDPGFKGWKGPYLPYPVVTASYALNHPKYNHVHIPMMSTAQNWETGTACTDPKDCYLWATINGITDSNMSTTIDKIVDGGDGLTVGNFQTTHSNTIYHLKIAPINYP